MPQGVINTDINNSISAAQQFITTVRSSIFNIMSAVDSGRFDKSFTQSGFQFGIGGGSSGVSSSSNDTSDIFPRNYNIASMNPTANVLIKKRMFTTLAYGEDVRFMDYSERAFIRTSKNLFQLKAFQIATYESLTKFEKILQQDHTLYIPSILSAIQNANAFGALSDDETSSMQSTLLQIVQRDMAGEDTNLTTWFIDQFDKDLANIGRGVGVIELTNFTKLDTSNRLDGESGSASVEFEDPYHIMMISNDDIENAIRGALFDNFTSTLLPTLAISDMRGLADNLQNQLSSGNPIIEAQATAAIKTVQEKSYDVLSQQQLSPDSIAFVRKRMRKFYLGKSVIQPTDGLHIFLKSDTIFENDEDPIGLPLGLDRFGVDEETLKQEMYSVTKNRNFDINLYKILRDKNAFSGANVFSGVVEKVTDNFADGFYTLSITAKNNLWYLEQSFINTQPALDQTEGLLHDPLTAMDYTFDNSGNIKTTNDDGNSGFKLSQDNINRLNQLNIKHESGSLRGNVVTQNNIVNGNVPGTDVQQVEHYPGMLYKWKEGIASVTHAMSTSDPTGLFYNNSREAINDVYGLAITSTPFDNMDAANVVSLLVTGQPYNISTFINDGIKSGALSSLANRNSSDASSYFSKFFDVVRNQNKVLGNFIPLLNGDSVSIDTIKKLMYKKISFNNLDKRIGQLEDQIFAAQQKLDHLPLNINGSDNDLLAEASIGLQAEIDALTQEENILIQQFEQVSSDINTANANQDALGFSTDPDTREEQMEDFQFKQLYSSSRRIEDVRYNRDINYFIVGTEYDADTDIQAFQLKMRSGGFNYFENKYDPAITKAREAAKTIDFEFFADNSGNIRFRPPQYNKVPLSIYYDLFRRKGKQGIDLLPDFVKNLFVGTVTSARESIVQLNWKMLIELGKAGNDAIVNSLNASVEDQTQGITEFLGYSGDSTVVSDGNVVNETIEFNDVDRVKSDRVVPPSTKTTDNLLSIDVLQTIATQLEKRFGNSRIVITEDDIIDSDDTTSITRRKELFKTLQGLAGQRNSLVKTYIGQLNNLGIDATATQDQASTEQAINQAVSAKQDRLQQEVLQLVSTSNIQGYTRPVISSEFSNLIEDDTRNFIGRGSGRRFIIRDDSIISFRIEEAQPDYCRVNVQGQVDIIDGHAIMENRWLWAGAVDYDSWRMYGFKNTADVTVPFLSDPESQLKPYAVFLLLRQKRRVMKGTITIIGNEYYQLGDVIYVSDRDMLFYVTGISHSYNEGNDFTTSLTIEYGRPPGEYIPTPLDVIGKTLLKQNTSSLSVTRRQMNPDTFYYPLRPTPVVYLANISPDNSDNTERMLRTDGNQGRLINALLNANSSLQKPNTILIITGFTTGSDNDSDVQSRIDVVKNWFSAPKIMSSALESQTLVDFTEYNAIPAKNITTATLDLTMQNDQDDNTKTDASPDDIVASDQSIISAITTTDSDFGITNPCQECYAFIGDPDATKDELPLVIEIGIFYKKPE